MSDVTPQQQISQQIDRWRQEPLEFFAACWPDMILYQQQREIIESVRDTPETFVQSATGVGKTRVASLAILHFVCTRYPARVIASSSSHKQLRNAMWPEVTALIRQSKIPLGIVVKDMELGWQDPDSKRTIEDHYVRFFVTNDVENFQGIHLPMENDIPRILVVLEESSAIEDIYYQAAQSFAHRILVIGNPLSNNNFFYKVCKECKKQGGWIPDPVDTNKPFTRWFKIAAADTPNVKRGRVWKEGGKEGTPPTLIPGIVTYREFLQHESQWDEYSKCTRLYGEFFEGAETKLFPDDWYNEAESLWRELFDSKKLSRKPYGSCFMGVDVAEGGRDLNCWCVLDQLGIVELDARPSTKEVTLISNVTKEKIERYGILPRNVLFDRGAGGMEHAKYLARDGIPVRAITFQESAKDRKIYLNRRAEMYGMLRQSLNPQRWVSVKDEQGTIQWQRTLVIPPAAILLKEEMTAMPFLHDAEGKMIMLPKRTKHGSHESNAQPSLEKLIGHSPDHADAFALANYARVLPLHPAPSKINHPLIYNALTIPQHQPEPEKKDDSLPRRPTLAERLFGPTANRPMPNGRFP